MSLTPAQQRLLDLCEDGEMTSDALTDQHGLRNESVLSLLNKLEQGGWIEILQRRRMTNFHGLPRRRRTVYAFRLTPEGLAQHAPEPSFPDQQALPEDIDSSGRRDVYGSL